MSTSTLTNGKPQRRQLSDQIDRLDQQLSDHLNRLDGILDTIAEELPGAVADACREGARQAMKDAILEVLTNPELRALIAPPTQPEAARVEEAPSSTPRTPEPATPSLWSRFKAKLVAAREAIGGTTAKAKQAVSSRCQAARQTMMTITHVAGESLPWRRMLGISFGIGLMVGLLCLAMPHALAATIGAVSATTTSLAVQTGHWLKRAARRFGLMS